MSGGFAVREEVEREIPGGIRGGLDRHRKTSLTSAAAEDTT